MTTIQMLPINISHTPKGGTIHHQERDLTHLLPHIMDTIHIIDLLIPIPTHHPCIMDNRREDTPMVHLLPTIIHMQDIPHRCRIHRHLILCLPVILKSRIMRPWPRPRQNRAISQNTLARSVPLTSINRCNSRLTTITQKSTQCSMINTNHNCRDVGAIEETFLALRRHPPLALGNCRSRRPFMIEVSAFFRNHQI